MLPTVPRTVGRLAAPSDSRFRPFHPDAVRQPHGPPPLPTVDRYANLPFARRLIRRIVQDEEIRLKLADREDMAVDPQLHANIGGVSVIRCLGSAHGLPRRTASPGAGVRPATGVDARR